MGDEQWAKWQRRSVLGGVFAIGFLIVWASHHWLSETSKEITQEIGVAFMVAAILGVTIDEASKNELIRNGFLAAFQYAFPAPLQKEILRIATYRLICERHHWLVKIEKIDDECVRVTCETNRKIRNIGSSVVKLGPKLHIDDWGFVQEPSEILECKMEVERGPTILAIAKETKDDQPTILFEGREVPIKPNGCFTLISKWSEIRRHNDLVYVSFAFPTLNPVIEIQVPDGFKAAPSFGAASEEVEEISTGRKAVSGTYLPYHYMVVRWWPLSHQLKALPAPR